MVVLVPWMDCVTVEAHFQLIALVAFLFIIIIPHFVSHFMFSIASSFDPVLIDEIFAGIAGSDAFDQPDACQSELQYPSDELCAAELKISSSLDPIRLIRLPDGCRVEGEIHFTVVIQNMSSQNLRVRAMPVFSEKAQALYMELGISLDQDAIELMVDGGGEQSLIWRFTAIAGKTTDFDPSLINAQDLVFQLRVAVEAVMP